MQLYRVGAVLIQYLGMFYQHNKHCIRSVLYRLQNSARVQRPSSVVKSGDLRRSIPNIKGTWVLGGLRPHPQPPIASPRPAIKATHGCHIPFEVSRKRDTPPS